MNKKIVVVTGSPRRNGNSFAMTDAFISAAQAMGHDVVRFDAAMMKKWHIHEIRPFYRFFPTLYSLLHGNRVSSDNLSYSCIIFTFSALTKANGLLSSFGKYDGDYGV